uniref:No apical meristem-associated C-terminal domain-containing protein n=1 Tax=Brassica oleracea var. oleracea TaxID=109376 RepID=A0A0D3ACC4_BRAOL
MDSFSLNSPGFVNLLSSQCSQTTQTIDVGSSDVPKPVERRKWTTQEDIVLISAWLNTSKDPIVSNQQKLGSFWKRIEDYFNSSAQLTGFAPREGSQCKERGGRVNEQVCKFVGSYEAALKEQASGQNENDVMKSAHDIFFNDYQAKFTLEHAWRELRFDQKWRSTSCAKDGAKEKQKEAAESVPDSDEARPPEYLRRPTAEDLQQLLDIGEVRGFPGMIGSIDCMHWEWKNCPTAWRGQYTRGSGKPTIVLEAVASEDLWIWHAFFGLPGTLNDINVLDRSPVFDDIIQGNKAELFAKHQESTRKDVERAFGVLQSRFAIVKNPGLLWDKEKLGKIMRTCVILHNMIVENERGGYSLSDTSQFESGESSRSSKVKRRESLHLNNMLGMRNEVRDSGKHDSLKTDLVENVWQKFGNIDE